MFEHLNEKTRQARLNYLARMGVTRTRDAKKLADIEKIYDTYVSSKSVQTIVTRLIHIVEFLKLANNLELLSKYSAKLTEAIAARTEFLENNTFENDPRSDRYFPLNELREKLKAIPSSPAKLLVSLYADSIPARNDYHDINIVASMKDIDPSRNNLVLTKSSATLVTDLYKTYKNYGRMILKLAPETFKLIKAHGFPVLKEDAFKKALSRAGLKLLGKSLTANDYRHIYETHLQGSPKYQTMTIAERNMEHAKLYHTPGIAVKYSRV